MDFVSMISPHDNILSMDLRARIKSMKLRDYSISPTIETFKIISSQTRHAQLAANNIHYKDK